MEVVRVLGIGPDGPPDAKGVVLIKLDAVDPFAASLPRGLVIVLPTNGPTKDAFGRVKGRFPKQDSRGNW